MSKLRSLAKTTAILSIGKILLHLATFSSLVLYTFFLSTEQYGAVELILVYATLIVPIATLRLEAAVFRYTTAERSEPGDTTPYLRYALSRSTIALAILMLLALIIAWASQHTYILLLWTLVACQTYYTIISEYTRGLGRNRIYATSAIIQAITLLSLSVAFVALLGWAIYGALSAMILSVSAALTYIVLATPNVRQQSSEISTELKHRMLGFSMPLIPSAISWWAINAADRTIIAIALGVSATGIYAVASKFAAVLMVLFPIFGMALTEAAILHINSKDRDEFFSKAFNVALRVSASLGMILIATAGIGLPFIIGDEFTQARLYIPILVVATLLNNVVGLYSAIYIAKKMTRQIMTMSFVAAGISIVLTIIGIGFIGLYAAAISTALAYGIMALWRHYEIKRIINISYDRNLLAAVILGTLVVTGLYYTDTVTSNIASLFIASSYAFWLNRRTIMMVRSLIKAKVTVSKSMR